MEITVNGRKHVVDAAPDTPLLYVLRDDLALDGPRFGCGLAQCGACTVLLDGTATRSCVFPISGIGSMKVTTIEGLAVDGKMSALQAALVEAQAPQCGYCMSGITMSAAALLHQTPHPSDQEIRAALDGNLCRCGTHTRVLKAIKAVSGGTA
jgi:nicotinate dehydrogenase subunit A